MVVSESKPFECAVMYGRQYKVLSDFCPALKSGLGFPLLWPTPCSGTNTAGAEALLMIT
jgi:hypothetical protein